MFNPSISDLVWSAVAPDSIPSNLLPSDATSLPSTVPDTVMFPVTSRPAPTSMLPDISTVPPLAILILSVLFVLNTKGLAVTIEDCIVASYCVELP